MTFIIVGPQVSFSFNILYYFSSTNLFFQFYVCSNNASASIPWCWLTQPPAPRTTTTSNCSWSGNGCNLKPRDGTNEWRGRQGPGTEQWQNDGDDKAQGQNNDRMRWQDMRRQTKHEKGPKRHQTTSLGPLVCFFCLLISLIFTNNFFLDTNYDDDDPEPAPTTHHCEPCLQGDCGCSTTNQQE